MKKLISLVAVFAIIATSSLCAFAADIDFASATDITAQAVDGVYTVAAPSTAAYATIVAVKGTEIKVGAIQYINQAAAEGGSASFSFALNDELVKASTVEDTKVYVLTGGDGNINVAGYIETEVQQPEGPKTFAISGTVATYLGTKLPTVALYNGTTLVDDITVTVTPNAEAGVADFNITNVPVLETGSYSVVITRPGYTTYTKNAVVAETTGIEAEIRPGNSNGDTIINIDDIGMIIDYYRAEEGAENYVEACNVSGTDTIINIDDIGVVIDNYRFEDVTE